MALPKDPDQGRLEFAVRIEDDAPESSGREDWIPASDATYAADRDPVPARARYYPHLVPPVACHLTARAAATVNESLSGLFPSPCRCRQSSGRGRMPNTYLDSGPERR